ncbi:hypothetical protein VOLCADRAFT_94311 [Volvox carteri f. nagariensis]|uniref:Chlorophyllase n=1 Tax=Volvox carteri f. nagariensis TaxID=3068 RepID=D8U460_VOLCA|nr:uncharacterized protein VOLCADRAFT_94311 [Volvox carteri f. nagariensis]EFJ45537.1 hypothetical protein VOLCADRAFT_94311 [Volvox carteri f. nagariensis]|eukprot:XP_002953564.1 hypothetical protein VOLCADRAFT_94311 [Volvox carteri f. nagariensis]
MGVTIAMLRWTPQFRIISALARSLVGVYSHDDRAISSNVHITTHACRVSWSTALPCQVAVVKPSSRQYYSNNPVEIPKWRCPSTSAARTVSASASADQGSRAVVAVSSLACSDSPPQLPAPPATRPTAADEGEEPAVGSGGGNGGGGSSTDGARAGGRGGGPRASNSRLEKPGGGPAVAVAGGEGATSAFTGSVMASCLAAPGAARAVQRTPAQCRQLYAPFLVRPDYSRGGPLGVARLPRLEHTCSSCFPACVNGSCTLRVEVVYPKGGPELGLGPPFPLAVFSAGFLLGSESYMSYAERLASWGYAVLMYDRNETVASLLDDAACVRLLVELMDWASTDPLMRRLADPDAGVYMVGHSRGGKLAALAGAEDARVAALCLIDPVDNTVYAPLAPGFPSALAALRNMPRERPLPLAAVGGGLGGDCAPRQANYRRFFAASTAPSWEVAIPEAGHFQFLDSLSGLQRALCPAGEVSDAAVRAVGMAVMVAWGESIIRHRGADIFHMPVPYPFACQQQQQQLARPSPSAGQFSTPPDPPLRPLQLSNLAELQQRQGLRGQASLAQAAYAAAAVRQQEPLLTELQPQREQDSTERDDDDVGVTGPLERFRDQDSAFDSTDRDRETSRVASGAAWSSASGSGGGGLVGGMEGGQELADAAGDAVSRAVQPAGMSMPPAEAAASSRIRPGMDRRQLPSGPGTAGDGDAGDRAASQLPVAAGAGRVVVVQDALRVGLDRMVTRLQYETGLHLETRYKNFDSDSDEGSDQITYDEFLYVYLMTSIAGIQRT